MTIFDQFFYSVFSFYKKRYKQKANTIALVYVSVLQISLIFLLGCFFAAFFNKMHAETISSTSAWTLFIIISIGIYFKNWIQYTGKKRMMINTKMIKKKKPQTNIWLLSILPVVTLALAYIVFQAI
ncbi:hypothetical protein [Jejuia spongiicola]|uniref:Uncharacterized protein n=1 Tax=Jejuia spongiicola TaxID=2942207 RepID=A0ABT0QBU2_9FLAO|nr:MULTISPECIES: hypothetical protein [Flavobacteriaceae]MCL6293734.1 hypothetical protein [Jejuia spongiicola]PIA78712.1 hypothetical protein BFR04_04035 [Gaetbulibacter sp. 4G1]